MSFKFSFFDADEPGETKTSPEKDQTDKVEEKLCEEIILTKAAPTEDRDSSEDKKSFSQISVNSDIKIKYLQQNDTSHVTNSGDHTDLIPGVYEGGRKTWECSFYLLDFLAENMNKSLKGKHVLEIGCGSAIPGIYCLLNGAIVTLQDYNKEVIEEVTILNTKLSCADKSELLSECKFFSGDWRHFNDLLVSKDQMFDVILASETIYSTASYEKQHNIFKSCCAEDGVIYIASKYHYFGVGGGVEVFQDFVVRKGVFHVEEVFATDENLKSVILKLSRRKT